jgi:Holliday junction resolvasome RuvABC endonuclease subunit
MSRGRSQSTGKRGDYKILGLDCSSSTIGWGIVDLGLNLLAYGHFKPLGSKFSEIERLNDVYDFIVKLCTDHNPDEVSIEDILLFMKGKSKARTTTLLSAVNRVAALAAYRNIHGSVNFYPVQTIRKLLKEITQQKSGKITKEEIPDIINIHIYDRFLDYAQYKKDGKLRDEMYDEADGIAAALAYITEREKE